MANIKILNGKEDKMVLFKANINDIGDYNKDLRSKIIDKSHLNNKNKNSLREDDTFILSFCEDKDKDLYIPDEVHEGIWNNQTFQYFKDKLIAHKIKEVTYKFSPKSAYFDDTVSGSAAYYMNTTFLNSLSYKNIIVEAD